MGWLKSRHYILACDGVRRLRRSAVPSRRTEHLGSRRQKRSVGAEIGKGSLGTKLGHPGARVFCYPPTPMGKLVFGMLSPT
jgi:hypothetical protein